MSGLFLLFSTSSLALDKGHIPSVSERDFGTYVMTAFQRVKLYYPLSAQGDSLVTEVSSMPTIAAKSSKGLKYGILLFYDLDECKRFMSSTKELASGKINTVPATHILAEMYKRKNNPFSTDKNNANFIIIENLKKALPTYEYLSKPDNNQPYYIENKGTKIIPAFINQSETTKYQDYLKSKGLALNNVGLDEKQFLQFILDKGQEGYVSLFNIPTPN